MCPVFFSYASFNLHNLQTAGLQTFFNATDDPLALSVSTRVSPTPVGVRFRVMKDGFLLGMRWYKVSHASNIGNSRIKHWW